MNRAYTLLLKEHTCGYLISLCLLFMVILIGLAQMYSLPMQSDLTLVPLVNFTI